MNHIVEILSTVREYNNVRITQTFSSGDKDIISVQCIPDTSILELTFAQDSRVEQYNTVLEAATVIDSHLNKNKVI